MALSILMYTMRRLYLMISIVFFQIPKVCKWSVWRSASDGETVTSPEPRLNLLSKLALSCREIITGNQVSWPYHIASSIPLPGKENIKLGIELLPYTLSKKLLEKEKDFCWISFSAAVLFLFTPGLWTCQPLEICNVLLVEKFN